MNLGVVYSGPVEVENPTPEKHFPSLYISGLEEPLEVGGSGKATVEFRLRSKEQHVKPGGKARYCYSFDIVEFTPAKGKLKKSDEEALDELRDEVSKSEDED